jgi:hypothetical protein
MTQVVRLRKNNTGYYVYIEAVSVDESLSNKLIKIPRPITKIGIATGKRPETVLVDLKRLEHNFTITGFISASTDSGNYGLSWSEGTITTAKDAKNALIRDILYTSDDIELYYRDYKDSDYITTYTKGGVASDTHIKVTLEKVSISDKSDKADAANSKANRYPVSISLIRGRIQ